MKRLILSLFVLAVSLSAQSGVQKVGDVSIFTLVQGIHPSLAQFAPNPGSIYIWIAAQYQGSDSSFTHLDFTLSCEGEAPMKSRDAIVPGRYSNALFYRGPLFSREQNCSVKVQPVTPGPESLISLVLPAAK